MFTAEEAKRANYICAAISLAILVTRITVSRLRQRPYDLSFYFVLLSIAVVITRIVLVYFYLLYGTASDAIDAVDSAAYFNTHNYQTIKAGSILSLISRVIITASCWLQICLLLLFYSHIMQGIKWVERMIRITWVAVALTFIATVLSTLLECRPLRLYWQVHPDPGNCVKGWVQLNLQCSSNIVLDLLLLAISYPILFCRGRSWQQHLRVGILFLLGTFCLAVTSARLALVYDSDSAQPTRSFWASVQMLVSTFVANAPTIYGDLKVTKRKKSEPTIRRESRPEDWHRLRSPAGDANLAMAERTASKGSAESSRKEWFDDLDETENGRIQWINPFTK